MADARFLALGDSYTIGEGVAPQARWPAQLTTALRGNGLAVAEPEIVAVTGWTTDELASGIERAAPAGPFDLVSLLIGVNDQYRGRSADAYRAGLLPLLRRAVDFAGDRPGRVLVVSIPDWGPTPFAAAEGRDPVTVGREIDRYNAVAERAARTARCPFVDVTRISRRAAARPALIAADGLHPAAPMYTLWLEALLPAARAALGRRPGEGRPPGVA